MKSCFIDVAFMAITKDLTLQQENVTMHHCTINKNKENGMKKTEYSTVRFSDADLFKKAKLRAVRQEISLMQLIEDAVKEYLKNPVDKVV